MSNMNCNVVARAIKLNEASERKRLAASKTDRIRRSCELGEAEALHDLSAELLRPLAPLKTASGGEIIPPMERGMPGLEFALKEPDLLEAEVTIKRSELAESAGVFEMAFEVAKSANAKNSIQRMQSHQLAAAHKYAMELLGDVNKVKDPIIKVKLINASAKLMEAYSKGALALQKLQTGASQVVQVQHVQVNGQAVIGNVGG